MAREIPAERLHGLTVDREALSDAAVSTRQKQYGQNDIIEVARSPWLELTKDTLKDPMIWFLVVTSAVYFGLGQTTECLTLLGSILPLVGMDAYLHRRTQASTQGLKGQLARRACALRHGAYEWIASTELVPGDLVLVQSGEAFPADGVIVQNDNVQVDESSLTGESMPARKLALDNIVRRCNEPIDNQHWGYAGTRVLAGQCTSRIIYTGSETLYGAIVRSAILAHKTSTPLQMAVSGLVQILLVIAGVLCLILAGIRLRQGHTWVDAFISAVTLAVAALPEEFPVVFTLFLGVGVYRLARRNALVRRAVCVENMGRITCICTDKTGTVTKGQLHLEHLLPSPDQDESQLLQLAAFASRWETADPLDRAILNRWRALGGVQRSDQRVVANYPYTELRRRETTVVQYADCFIAVTKGSPETLLPMSNLSKPDQAAWINEVERLATGGHKVLACLWWRFGLPYVGGEPDCQGSLAGLLAFEDPLREGVAEAVQECRHAGIRVIMVTGDHPATARSIAREMGLAGSETSVISGDELVERIDKQMHDPLAGIDVIARSLPMHKLALVQTLQGQGDIVAVTGDGVNDVPALQAADIGIAMGERGTQSAREVASIILLDDNFQSIVRSIAEGRQLFRNLQLSFQYLLMMHIPLVMSATFIPLAGHPLLFEPVHIIWLEMIMHPTALLVFQELPATKRLSPQFAWTKARFFSRADTLLMAMVGTVLTSLVLWSYERSHFVNHDMLHARAMAMAVLASASAIATIVLSSVRTKTAAVVALLTLLLSFVLIQTPASSSWLHLSPLHIDDLAIAYFGASIAVLVPFFVVRLFSYPAISKR